MRKRFWAQVLTVLLMVVLWISFSGLGLNQALAQEAQGKATAQGLTDGKRVVRWDLAIAIAVSIGLSCLGAAYAVGKVGAAAMGAASEKPELLTRSLLFVALAEGIAIYGLLIAILLWTKL